mmetsp:Transcript_26766/g.19175  ORF Transcript_26766/g.19175 Transcript_26766/m.19175 type:complete len:231 (-) Transcript_26766:222-914(-)
MLSVSICALSTEARSVDAMSLMILRRVNSFPFLADPTIMSALATSLRSVLATMPSQKMLIPPSTIGIEAVSVVLTCHGFSPAPGSAPALASSSMALITMSTKMLLLRVLEALLSSTMDPSGILNDTNWSGISEGEAHIVDCGAHGCSSASLKRPFSGCVPSYDSPMRVVLLPAAYVWHVCSISSAASTSARNVPSPTRTESRGISPLLKMSLLGLLFTLNLSPSVNVTWM